MPGKLWLLKVALYGLNDASLQFYLQCREVLISLGCQQSKVDPAMFFKLGGRGELIGCVGLHVDNFLHCGTFLEELNAIFKAINGKELKPCKTWP